MNKNLIGIIAAVILVLGGIFWLSSDSTDAPSESVKPSSHVIGEGTAGVTLVEYGDFECPGCGAYYPTLKQVKEKYGDRITFQFRHFPLTQIHPNAFAAHRAAEAAGMQGKFWEMHDLLFENQASWSAASNVSSSAAVAIFEGYAQQISLDMEKYKEDYRSSAVNAVINADVRAGQEVGASSTPSFVLNGKLLTDGPRNNLASFSEVIDAALAEQAGSGEQSNDPDGSDSSQSSSEQSNETP